MFERRFTLVSSAFILLCLVAAVPATASDSFQVETGYQDGFYLRSTDPNGPMLKFGGSIWAEYHYYGEKDRADNRFDIKKARLRVSGQVINWLQYYAEYEFNGSSAEKHMTDVYVDWLVSKPVRLRGGQFKEPFSLEWQTTDRAILFAERSMGYYLSPHRDVGLMAAGGFYKDMFNFGAGVFNGNGEDGSTRGSYHDEPELTARLVIKPFAATSINALKQFQIGASGSTKKIDASTINLQVKSTGMVGTSLNVYVLNANTKFGVIQEADLRQRYGLEAAWAMGPFAVSGEYTHLEFTGLKPANSRAMNAIFYSWYAAAAWCITGEPISLTGGVVNIIVPSRPFKPSAGTYGAFALALRTDHFIGDPDWIKDGENISSRRADAFSAALNWFLLPQHRVLLEYTYTSLSDPIKVRVNPVDGSIDYIDKESTATLRYCLDF
ncbi:MAG TPA: porin [Desulfomonilia bacterium]